MSKLNSTQRKYVATEIFNTLSKKFKELQLEDKKLRQAAEKLKPTQTEVLKAIKAGKIRLVARIGKNAPTNDLWTYFRKEDLDTIATEKAGDAEVPCHHYVHVRFTNKLTREGVSEYFYMESVINRVTKLQARMDAICTELMLGDADEARAMIERVSKEQF